MNAMILAAGRGNRLMPLTKHIPKPLIKINGKSILRQQLDGLHNAGFLNVVINISYLGHLILKEFGYRHKGLNISYSFEPTQPLETAGGIAFAKPWRLLGQPFLVINSDIICDWPLSKALRISSDGFLKKKLAYLVLTSSMSHHGDFYLSKNTVFNTVGDQSTNRSHKLTFTGIGIYRPEFFNGVRRGTSRSLRDVLIPAIGEGLVMGEYHDGIWEDIGTKENLKRIENIYKSREEKVDERN
tara:strand:+ start:19391 stop:20116 length:726 start_codon:yes stop_codon:yes gene_type:complete